MFVGEYTHTIDAKGRIFVPAKLRDDLSKVFFITKGNDKCISVYSDTEWEKLAEKFNNLPAIQRRHMQRFFFSSADKQELDAQGRFTLSAEYREYAGLDKEAIVVGNNNVIEIWSKENWDAEKTLLDNQLITDELMKMGF